MTRAAAQLGLSPEGNLAAAIWNDRLLILDLAGPRPIRADAGLEGLTAITVADGEIWAVTDDGAGERALHRLDRRGRPKTGPIPLEGIDGALSFDRGTVSPAGAVLLGDAPALVRADCGELSVELVRSAPAFVTPLSTGGWLQVVDGRLGLDRGAALEVFEGVPPLPRGTRVVAASALLGGRAVAVQLAGAESMAWVIDVHTGELRRRLPLADCTRAAIVAAREHILSLAGGALRILHLRYGRALVGWRCEPPLLDVAVCAQGRVAVALKVEDGAPGIAWVEYRDLLRRQQRLEWQSLDGARTVGSAPVNGTSIGGEEEPAAAESGGDEVISLRPPAESEPVQLWPATEGDGSPELEHDEVVAPPPPLPGSLCALGAGVVASASGGAALRGLEHSLALVAAWAQRAICEGWDSGRVAHPRSDELPFEHEVEALLGVRGGRVAERLAAARAEEQLIAVEHDRRLAAELTACAGDGAALVSPLCALAHELGLGRTDLDVLLVIAAPAIWPEMARLYAICANDPERPTCDEWLVTQVLGQGRAGRREISAALDPGAPLVRQGLVQVGRGQRPVAALAPHPLVVRRLFGDDFGADPGDDWVYPSSDTAPYEELLLRGEIGRTLRALAHPSTKPTRLVVRGVSGCGRRSLLAALAQAAGRRLGMIDLARLVQRAGQTGGPLAAELGEALLRARLRGWLPCLDTRRAAERDAGAERDIATAVAAFAGPVAVRAERGESLPLAPGYALIDLEPLSEGERLTAWRRALAARGLPAAPARALAAGYRFGPGVIGRVVARAAEAAGGLDELDLTRSLEDEVRQYTSGRMGDVASRVERLPTWSQVCLPPEVLDSVREIIGRVRHRLTVFERWGFDRVMSTSRGLTALFEGRPGTGKTLVAGLIARELGYDLYRVDLSRVLSKWVGETERQLAEVFDAAEGGRVIVLFDEADSLFGKRTEVKSANDRFANIEVNYLLQRLDTFEGIAILTTNFGKSIDPAFKRRLSVRLSFPFPDEELREQLWRAHLPPELPSAQDLQLGELARKYPLSGGYIRNIVLRAAFLAAHEARPLAQTHLDRAVALEYRSMGKLTAGGVLE